MTNKEASAKQEKMVADFMGWDVVSGSGARPFAPGDVKNDYYLVECKTHVDEKNNIIFYKKHWIKILTESQSIHKYPALIVDNGTQKSQNTWVMIPRSVLPTNTNIIAGAINTSKKDTTFTFNHNNTYSLYKSNYKFGRINCISTWFDNYEVAILSLEEFKNYYHQEFES